MGRGGKSYRIKKYSRASQIECQLISKAKRDVQTILNSRQILGVHVVMLIGLSAEAMIWRRLH